MAERYEPVEDFGCSNFDVGRLVKDKKTNELFAVKYIERGYEIDEKVQREIFSHRSLRHPNIVLFKEVFVTRTHLAIVMEYASGGDLFNRIRSAGRFSEDEVKKQVLYSLYTFQRITISEIKQHPWFLEILQTELFEEKATNHSKSDGEQPVQSEEDILRIIEEAKTPGEATTSKSRVFGW